MKTFAGFWQRLGAFALDYLLLLGYLLALTLIFLLLNSVFPASSWLFAERVRAQLIAFLLLTLPITLYFAVTESSARQATWGKQKLKLMVSDQAGSRITFWRALGRNLLKFIPWEISHTLIWQIQFSQGEPAGWINYGFGLVYVLVGLNMASLLISKTKQSLYDWIAGTYVIRRPETPE